MAKRVGNEAGDEEEDLGELARTTLSGVEVCDVPPEPFALGVDLGRLASTSRPPAPPRADDTDARIDLRASSPGSVPAAAASTGRRSATPGPATPAELAARLRSSRAPARPSLAPAAVPARVPSAASAPTPAARELDELIASRAFSPTAALAAHAERAVAAMRGAPSWTWALVGGVAIGLVIGVGFSGDDTDDADDAASTAIVSSVQSPTPNSAMPVLPQVVATSHGSTLHSPASPRASRDRDRGRAGSDRAPTRPSTQPSGQGVGTEPEAPKAPLPVASGAPRSIDTLLDQALGGGAAQTATATARPVSAGSDRPSTPAREDVARILSALLPRIRFCAGGRSGVAKAQIVAKSTGRISSVHILGAPFSRTSAGRCMESVIRGVGFPAFSRSNFRVTYPYAL